MGARKVTLRNGE